MHRPVAITLAAGAGLALLAACGSSGGSPAAGGHTVDIRNYAYSPGDLAVPVGTAVTWTMRDDGTVHDVVDAADGIRSGDLKTSGGTSTFTYTFIRAGSYHYLCTYHQYMKGTITVR